MAPEGDLRVAAHGEAAPPETGDREPSLPAPPSWGSIHRGLWGFFWWNALWSTLMILPAVGLLPAVASAWNDDFKLVPADEPALAALMFLVGAAAWLSTYCHCRRSAACMRGVGFRRRGLSRDLAVGLAAGIATFSIVPVLAILCGWAAMRGGGPGGAFAPPGAVLLSLIGSCATLLPAAFAEEASTRGVPLTLVARRNTTLAVIGTSLIFAMLHAGNTGIEIIGLLDAFLGGILLAILRLRTGTLWLATGWHFGWNLAQGWLFGANISGHSPALDPLLSLRMDGPTFMVGGIYGPESGLLSILAELIAIAVTLRFVRRAAPD